MDHYNKYQTKQCTHRLPHCTHTRWWLVLGWVTTKEDHPRLRITCISYIWRVIKYYITSQLLKEPRAESPAFSWGYHFWLPAVMAENGRIMLCKSQISEFCWVSTNIAGKTATILKHHFRVTVTAVENVGIGMGQCEFIVNPFWKTLRSTLEQHFRVTTFMVVKGGIGPNLLF
jgi:hypothetical protein